METKNPLARFGRLAPHEQRFANMVWSQLNVGHVPGPTRLNQMMRRKKSNNLGGRLSQIRIALFESMGLVKRGYNGRYYWPEGSWQATRRPVR